MTRYFHKRTGAGLRGIALSLFAISLAAAATSAEATSLEQGRALLQESCASCHAIGESGASPLAAAPTFRTLHERYPLESLEEALAEGIISGHPAMPEASFEPDEIGDIIAYLKSLSGD